MVTPVPRQELKCFFLVITVKLYITYQRGHNAIMQTRYCFVIMNYEVFRSRSSGLRHRVVMR